MARSVLKVAQSFLFIAILGQASCGVRPDSDSDTPAVTTPVVDQSAVSATPTTVVGETPVTTPVVTAPAAPATPTSPETPLVVLPTPTTPETPSIPQPLPATSWTIVSEQFFVPNCVRCHGAAGGISVQTYDSAKLYLEEIRAAVLVDKSMPPRKTLPTTTTDILKAWIDAGAPQ